MDDSLIDPWLKEVQGLFSGLSIIGLEQLSDGLIQLSFGRRHPRLLFQLQPRRIWCCFSRRLAASRKARTLGPAEELLRGGSLGAIHRLSGEHILWLTLGGACGGCRQIVVELAPASPNLLLLDPENVVQWMFNSDRLPGRSLHPGVPYRVPGRPPRLSLEEALKHPPTGDEPVAKWLLRHVEGVSPGVAAELVRRAGGSLSALPEAAQSLTREPLFPHLYSSVGLEPLDRANLDPWKQITLSAWRLSPGPPDTPDGCTRSFATANEALECFAEIALECQEFQTLRDRLLAATGDRVKRLVRSQSAARRDLAAMETPERFRLFGEQLLCHLGQLQQAGGRQATPMRVGEVCVANIYAEAGTTLSIQVDPAKSLQANAEAYFRSYRKAQRGAKLVEARLMALQQQLEPLLGRQREAALATEMSRLQELAEQILPSSSPRSKASKDKRGEKGRRRSYSSSEGYEILVGQNANNNEELTFRLAAPTDLWLHAADYAGSHVIVRNPSRQDVPAATLLEAARLAAFYSAARKEAKVDVRYTQRKFVHKLKGAAPGLVRLQNYKTLRVEPSRRIAAPASL